MRLLDAKVYIAWKVSKYGLEKFPYLVTFHTVINMESKWVKHVFIFFTLDKKTVKPRKKCHMIPSEWSDYEVMVGKQ